MVTKAVELAKTHGWFLTRQFENEANPDYPLRTTAREIVDDFKGEKLDYWVTGYGTGGTLKGVARVLAKEMPDTKIVVCEPEDAQLSRQRTSSRPQSDGSAARRTRLQAAPDAGLDADFIPKLTGDAVT
jgi:cysteine synthase A